MEVKMKLLRYIPYISIILLFVLIGCDKQYILNTEIEDTPFNRRVIDFCEKYRHAVERQDIAEIIKMTSKHYYEDNGTTTGDDDYDYAGLREKLTKNFARLEMVRYEISYKYITKNNNRVTVDYIYSTSFKAKKPDGSSRWFSGVHDNRLVLEIVDNDDFKILSGM